MDLSTTAPAEDLARTRGFRGSFADNHKVAQAPGPWRRYVQAS